MPYQIKSTIGTFFGGKMNQIENILNQLAKSKFRNSFHLKEKDKEYIREKGMGVIERHAYDFINQRLKIHLSNDGKQTPMKGHPVFVAEHATATCCRGCLFKWHHIEPSHELTKEEIDYIVNIILTWIEREIS